MSRASGTKRSAEDSEAAATAGYHGQHAHPYLAHSLAVTSSSAAAVGSAASLTTTAAMTTSSSAAAAASNAGGATVGSISYRPTAAAVGSLPSYPVPNGKSEMVPRSSTSAVSEEVWAKAIHAVKIQKMSLRQAAQLYGVHHMSLHRRVRGRYASPLPPSSDIRAFLTPDDEAEVLGVLREQFLHEKRITTDDIRFVVRAIASQGGKQSIPAEFPPSRWIHDFKRAHGFAKLNSYAYPPTGTSQQGDDNVDDMDDSASSYSAFSLVSSQHSSSRQARGHRASTASGSNSTGQQNGRRSGTGSVESNYEAADREDYNSSTGNGSMYDTGLTTGSSSGGSYENGESEKRTYRLSHTVPPETWEKAIAAVEQQGMSLRSAAKMYGVHFAALHRRVKKRAQGEQATGIEGYFQPDDEAGIIRVVVARAELGVLMNFDELMDLAQRAALRNLPDLSVEAARKLMTRFQSRNEHSIRHIIADWPSPRTNPITAIPRVVNDPEPAPRSSSMTSASSRSGPASAGVRPPSPRGMRGYAAAQLALGRIQSLPNAQHQQQQNGELNHSPLPSLRSEFPPPPPASSIFSRHTGPLVARRVPQPMSSGAVGAAGHRSDNGRYVSHDDRAPRRDHHHHAAYDSNSSYDDDDDERNRRDSGSSEGDAVMFV